MSDPTGPLRPAERAKFPVTRWMLVAKVRSGVGPARAALDELCTLYWRPIYAYLRGRSYSPQDAEDYTQQFFAEILADETLHAARAGHGRLHTFLLAALQRSLADQTRRRCRQKRGGGLPEIPLEVARAEMSSFAWDTDAHREIAVLRAEAAVTEVAFSPHESLVAVSTTPRASSFYASYGTPLDARWGVPAGRRLPGRVLLPLRLPFQGPDGPPGGRVQRL